MKTTVENTAKGLLRTFLSNEQFEKNIKFYDAVNKIDAALLERIRDIFEMFQVCNLSYDEKIAYIVGYNSRINEHEQPLKIEYFS